jgi:hypothetical protein
MSTLAEIEAALPSLSTEELTRIELALHRLQRERGRDERLDGQRWPSTPQEVAALLADLDSLPPLLTPEESDRFETWRAAEKQRQKALSAADSRRVGELFS